MPEETLFKMEKAMDNASIAKQLRKIADKLESNHKITLKSGSDSVELDTDRDAVFDIQVERENGEESLELEIEWKKGKKDFEIE